MPESKFWHIYFTLASRHLPEESTGGQQSSQITSTNDGNLHTPSRVEREGDGHAERQGDQERLQSGEGDGTEGNRREGGKLSSDDELDAFLENVLKEEASGSGAGDFEDFEHIDEYLDQLNSEAGADTDPVEVLSADVASYQSGQTNAKEATA